MGCDFLKELMYMWQNIGVVFWKVEPRKLRIINNKYHIIMDSKNGMNLKGSPYKKME